MKEIEDCIDKLAYIMEDNRALLTSAEGQSLGIALLMLQI